MRQHPCTQECLRRLASWKQQADARGDPAPGESLCDGSAVVESESCAECDTVLRSIAGEHGWSMAPARDAATEAS